ncbi:MAG: glutathione S-transferase family protein, partial [Janthinobacterium lividum]
MAIIETRRPDIAALTGLHLWHAAMSNCSQRVRLVLEEKSLTWTSHLLDLFTFEHASADYQSIHPKGLVPALVHDGRTIIDSNDIIRYLDFEFPWPSLAAEAKDGDDLIDLADAIQLPLRTVSHELMLGDIRRLDRDTLEMFERQHGNREFYQFLRRFSTEGFDDAHLAACLETLKAALVILEKRLASQEWLAGEAFSLVDVSWVVNVHRLARIDYPLQQYSQLSIWFA